MPKLYEYLGILVLFYSNEHEPIHVHGQCQGRESKAELIVENGKVVQTDRDSTVCRGDCAEMDRLLRAPQADRGAANYTADQMRLAEGAVIDIVRVEQMSDYELKLSFSDGVERVIDFAPFLRSSRNPLIHAFLDPHKFADFTLEYGNLMWADYGLCFPIANLYENTI